MKPPLCMTIGKAAHGIDPTAAVTLTGAAHAGNLDYDEDEKA
jgi:hypothetical protein